MRNLLLVAVAAMSACHCGGGKAPKAKVDPPDPVIDGRPVSVGSHPRIYLPRNRDRLEAALDANGRAAKKFRDMVDTQVSGGDDFYAFEAWFAALMGQLTGEAKYCAYAVAQVEAKVASEEQRIAAGETAEVAGDSYLYVGAVIGDLALTYDWCFDAVSADQRTRWLAYAQQAVWNVWHHDDATWGGNAKPWTGWGADDPSNNYYYSFLRATMLFGLAGSGDHPDAAAWATYFRDDKIGGELVPRFERDLAGGGSREGTGYGVSMRSLWELYDLWEGSTGERIADLTPHARASLLFYPHAIVPTRDFIAPIGDHSRESTAALFDYERIYLMELAHLYPDDRAVPVIAGLLARSTVPELGTPFLYVYDFLYDLSDVKPASTDALGRAWYGPGIGELFARSSWATDATWLGFIAGPYTEPHAHHDQGSFLLYKEGWLAYDAIVESHSGTLQDDEMHNLVRLDGPRQKQDTESKVLALHRGDDWLHVAADVLPAYGGDARVSMDQRELVYLEPDVVVVFDRVTTDKDVDQIWQLNAPVKPTVSGQRASFGGKKHTLLVDRISPARATTKIVDWRDTPDYNGGWRFEARGGGGARVMLHVLSIDKAVKAVKADDADGRTGVTITLADGRTATVRFSPTGVDTTLTLGKVTTSLGEGIDPLPEWLR